MNGTEWTEPGQGSTRFALVNAPSVDSATARALCEMRHRFEGKGERRRTNLRLTGHPLTAYDLKRIEQCEVTR